MTETDWLAERFEENRKHLRKVARRILGSSAEADDALQETWLRASRADTGAVNNLTGWLTTTVARVCLDMLRARRVRQPRRGPMPVASYDAEAELVLADSIGPALLIVLETLDPAERVSFVLHDIFDLSFDDVARIVGRSSQATRQLASRARRRVQGDRAAAAQATLERHREVVQAFLDASKHGNFDALLDVLDPEMVARADDLSVETAAKYEWAELKNEMRGARVVAEIFNKLRHGARPALIDGRPGAAWVHEGRLMAVWLFTIAGRRITELELVMDRARLPRFTVEPDA